MGTRQGKGNRLRFDAKDMLSVLSHSVTKTELVEEFKLLPVAEKLNLMIRLADASGAPVPRPEGGGYGK